VLGRELGERGASLGGVSIEEECNILEFSSGMLAMRKCGFQNFDLKLSA
jgi:hypothetical protein